MSEYDIFYGHGTDNPWDESRLLICHAINLPWHTDSSWYESTLTIAEREVIVSVLRARIIDRVPVAYITGVAWFCDLAFYVDERVLIPRSPIGELIQNRFEGIIVETPNRILDLCSGSGCIGIAAAIAFDRAQIELLDISYEAQEVAEQNIQFHHVEDRVVALQSDLFGAADGRYDLIIANPPYVDQDDMDTLPEEYRHEPELALASGIDGLDLPIRILKQSADFLTDEGTLVIEVGNSWPALMDLHPTLSIEWITFERGGHGVGFISASTLKEWVASLTDIR